MEESRGMEAMESVVSLNECLGILRPHWWKIILVTSLVALATVIVFLRIPNMYRSAAVITPVVEEKKQIPSIGLLGVLGSEIGGASKIEDLETLFNSKDLTARVFLKYDLWQIVYPDRFDTKTGKLKVGLFNRIFRGEDSEKSPDDWDAIRTAENRLSVVTNKKSGTLLIAFESPSPEGSANIVQHYLEEAKSRLQEEAFDRASKNKQFIEKQIDKTVDALNRERLYGMYGQEVEREMMAQNREQFAFKVIDSPRVPDRKSSPERAWAVTVASMLSFLSCCLFFVVREKRRQANPSGA